MMIKIMLLKRFTIIYQMMIKIMLLKNLPLWTHYDLHFPTSFLLIGYSHVII